MTTYIFDISFSLGNSSKQCRVMDCLANQRQVYFFHYNINIFRIHFVDEIFKIISDETNLYTVQQINKKEQEGPLERNSYLQWKTCHTTGPESVLCSCHSHASCASFQCMIIRAKDHNASQLFTINSYVS
jgi:hypothetical protein